MSITDLINNDPEMKKAMDHLHSVSDKENWHFPKNRGSAQEIIIKKEAMDISSIKDDKGKDRVWRPSEFSEYIGQEKLKKILEGYIGGTKKRGKVFPHMLIDGPAGTGKTTIAYLTAKQLGVPFVECVATSLNSGKDLGDIISEANGGIVFIDEIHMLNEELANTILPILEDFQVRGQPIKPFTLFACTTEKGRLLKKFKPLVDRMKIQKTLEPYTIEDMIRLASQYTQKTFANEKIDANIYNTIAENCRLTPRIAIRYLESYVYMETNIEEVLQSYDIVKDGFTIHDIKVLELLNSHEKGVGLQAIAGYLGTSEENYLYSIEHYLLYNGFIVRLPRGRIISEKGKKFYKDIKDEKMQ